MRVVQIINGLRTGGAERLLVQLCGSLAGHCEQVTVYCLTRTGELAVELRGSGVPVHRLTWGGLPSPWAFARLIYDLRRADVLHTHFFYSDLLGSLLSRMVPIPRRFASRHETGYWMGPIHRKIEPWVYRGCARVLCVSEAVRRSLEERGIGASKLQHLPPGLIEAATSVATDEATEAGKQGPYLLAVGRLEAVKGHDVLLEAFAQVAGRLSEWRLVLAGPGSQRRQLEEMTQRLGLGGRVVFAGDLRPREVTRLLRHASLFVLPSRSEALSLSLLEAMQQGRACIASGVDGVPELLEHGVTGWLVKPADASGLAQAIEFLATDRNRTLALGARAREFATANYTMSAFRRRVRDLYGVGSHK